MVSGYTYQHSPCQNRTLIISRRRSREVFQRKLWSQPSRSWCHDTRSTGDPRLFTELLCAFRLVDIFPLLSALFCPCCELSALFLLFLTRCHTESTDLCFLQHEYLDRVSPGFEFPFFLHTLWARCLGVKFGRWVIHLPRPQSLGSKHMPTFFSHYM